ncbi:MAG TPA: hypothetical protein P5205_06270 [Candidatus Paceibacterota bacterium]|nr:hypothetical protein [Verrucomicrobiota bacterium]HSA09960.1 hypothetical protein [Candidatus Paceibacterota bacterium]
MDKTTLALIGALVVLTGASLAWLCFILWRHRQWSAFVDWEYNLWVRLGLIFPSLAEKCKRLEKGPVLKCLVGATVLLGVVFLVIAGLCLFRS